VIWVGETEVKVVIQSNGMEAIIPQVRCGVPFYEKRVKTTLYAS
jgi:hypothetical protein